MRSFTGLCVVAFVALLMGAETAPEAQKKDLLRSVVVVNKSDTHTKSLADLEATIAYEVAKTAKAQYGDATFGLDGETLYVARSDAALPPMELFRIDRKSDCPNNSIFGIQVAEQLAGQPGTKTVIQELASSVTRHRHGVGPDTKVLRETWRATDEFETVLDLDSSVIAP